MKSLMLIAQQGPISWDEVAETTGEGIIHKEPELLRFVRPTVYVPYPHIPASTKVGNSFKVTEAAEASS